MFVCSYVRIIAHRGIGCVVLWETDEDSEKAPVGAKQLFTLYV